MIKYYRVILVDIIFDCNQKNYVIRYQFKQPTHKQRIYRPVNRVKIVFHSHLPYSLSFLATFPITIQPLELQQGYVRIDSTGSWLSSRPEAFRNRISGIKFDKCERSLGTGRRQSVAWHGCPLG